MSTSAGMGELVEVRIIGTPQIAAQTIARMPGLFDSYRLTGPTPSRKTPGAVIYYVTGLLRPISGTPVVPRRRRAAR
jgi:hypothetical protein